MVLTSVFLNLIICMLLFIYKWRHNKAIIYMISLILLANMRHTIMLLLNQPIESRVLAVLLVHFDPVVILIGPFLLVYFLLIHFPITFLTLKQKINLPN